MARWTRAATLGKDGTWMEGPVSGLMTWKMKSIDEVSKSRPPHILLIFQVMSPDFLRLCPWTLLFRSPVPNLSGLLVNVLKINYYFSDHPLEFGIVGKEESIIFICHLLCSWYARSPFWTRLGSNLSHVLRKHPIHHDPLGRQRSKP